MINYSRNQKYFNPGVPWSAYFLWFIGFLFSFYSIISFLSNQFKLDFLLIQICVVTLSLLFILAGTQSYFKHKRSIPTDTEIDNAFKGRVYRAVNEGYRKLGISLNDVNQIEPIVVKGYLFDKVESIVVKGYLTDKKISIYYSKVGKDGLLRSSNCQCVVIYLSRKQLFVYNIKFSLVHPEIIESTEEYFYPDIVTISTSSAVIEINETFNIKGIKKDYFQLITTGGNALLCPIDDLQSIEQSLHMMRHLVRQHKNKIQI